MTGMDTRLDTLEEGCYALLERSTFPDLLKSSYPLFFAMCALLSQGAFVEGGI